jgi:hypothetical protein
MIARSRRCREGGNGSGRLRPLTFRKSLQLEPEDTLWRFPSATETLPRTYWVEQLLYLRALPDEVRDLVREYTHHMDRVLNERLRTGWEGRASQTTIAWESGKSGLERKVTLQNLQRLQNAILLAPPLPVDILVFRGLKVEECARPPKIGTTTALSGIQSFTISGQVAAQYGNRLLVARVRAGTPALWIQPESQYWRELEIIFPHGTVITFEGMPTNDVFLRTTLARGSYLEVTNQRHGRHSPWVYDLSFPTFAMPPIPPENSSLRQLHLIAKATASSIPKSFYPKTEPDPKSEQPLRLDEWLRRNLPANVPPQLELSLFDYPSFALSPLQRRKSTPPQVYERILRPASLGRWSVSRKSNYMRQGPPSWLRNKPSASSQSRKPAIQVKPAKPSRRRTR